MSSATPLQTVQEIYEAFKTGDLPGILSRVSEEVDWEVYGPAELPFAGHFDGHDGATRFFATIADIAEHTAFEPGEFTAEGERVIASGREQGIIRANGRAFETNWVHAFTVRDGRVVRFRLFTDTAHFVDVMATAPGTEA